MAVRNISTAMPEMRSPNLIDLSFAEPATRIPVICHSFWTLRDGKETCLRKNALYYKRYTSHLMSFSQANSILH